MKRYRIISMVLIFIILFSNMVLSVEKKETITYNEGYDLGYKDGKNLALENNKNKNNLTYDQVKPSRSGIEKEYYYYLKEEAFENIEKFINGYLEGFKRGYESFIDEDKEKNKEEPGSILINLGLSLGMIYGEIAGFKDFESGTQSNWKVALPNDSDLKSEFDLNSLSSRDKEKFIENFKHNFQIGYEKAYYNEHFGSKKDSMDAGRVDGITFGTLVGNIFGAKDYYEGKNSDFNRNMPSNREIIEEYSLKKDNKEYSEGFINGFKNSYEESYLNSFRDAKNNINLLEDSLAYDNGFSVGKLKGEIQASIDNMEKKSNDWKRSEPLSSSIILEYNLIYQGIKYRDNFINGYFDGYSFGYTEKYKELSQIIAINKSSSETIPISGLNVLSSDGIFTVDIDKGIYYNPIILTIDNLANDYNISNRYILASDIYRLSIINPSANMNNGKKIKISFEYYGDLDGGIYKLENGKWRYLNSTIEEGYITSYINPENLNSNGNVFAVLVDKETEVFHDIRGHWAKDEITTYIRRGVINGYPNKTFKPDQNITRAEFLVLLSRLYEWYLPPDTSNIEFFKDHKEFKYSEKYISYGLSNQYIIGYPDKYFRPYNNITYKEVDIIMKKVLKDSKFKWQDYAEKMIYDKKVRSSSYDSIHNNITRAEFSYMLYKINE